MKQEIAEIPGCIAHQIKQHGPLYKNVGRRLRAHSPTVMITVARGSSDCAAAFLKHLVEVRLGVPVASVGPSLSSVYGQSLWIERAVSWAISQSGASEDINALHCSNRAAGALSISLVNSPNSRLAQNSDIALPIGAWPELALPATKSFVCSLVAIAAIVSEWTGDRDLFDSLHALPELVERSYRLDWGVAEEALAGCESALILGRGAGYPIACEAALKLKETSYIFAEAFSAAEVWHGPAALITPERPVILIAPADEASVGAVATAEKVRALGARVFVVSSDQGRACLPVPNASNSVAEAIAMIARFYALAERLSGKCGVNVDSPRALQKVTVTI
ncbi:SIS domain-containing protein [Nitratireductor sp. StC3]|uniref:SIS domain-containing protein n=1 Tax=Nitratireductor sp. StC3 TaxID=2126741 RepID=UPI001304DC71|nr:SIS domain-containing protein [Nitratireductor sp. StC3]